MTNEPGLYIVKVNGERLADEHFMWIYKKGNKLHYIVDLGQPQAIEGECEFDLDRYTLLQKVGRHSKDLVFSNTKITVTTEMGGYHFEFTMRNAVRFFELTMKRLPGIGKSLMIQQMIQTMILFLKQEKEKKS